MWHRPIAGGEDRQAGRAAKRQRRSSFGAAGGLWGARGAALAGHSFLLTGFGQQQGGRRQLEERITKLGGLVLDEVPRFQVCLSSLSCHEVQGLNGWARLCCLGACM